MEWLTLIIILVTVCVSVFFIKRYVPAAHLKAWSDTSTIVGGIAAAISLLLGAYTYYESEKTQKRIEATNIYQESTKLSIEHPEFSNERLAPKPPRLGDSAAAQAKYEAYRWYVGNVLFSYETILDALPGDVDWEKTTMAFMRDHKEYITTDSVKCDRYTDKMQNLMKKATGSCRCICSVK